MGINSHLNKPLSLAYLLGFSTYYSSISTNMATRIGFRNVLGDITKQQNIPQKAALVDAKMATRQAAAKKLTPEVVCDGHEDLALERSLPAGVVDIDKKDLENPQLCAEYTQDAIKQMEMKILQTLKFSLFEPLSIHFLRR